jgi:phage shock protein A
MSDQSQNNFGNRVTDLEISMGDVKQALNQLIDYSVQNERRLTNAIDSLAQSQQQTLQIVERVQNQMLELQTQVVEIQSEVRGLQTENRRIWQVISDRLGLE